MKRAKENRRPKLRPRLSPRKARKRKEAVAESRSPLALRERTGASIENPFTGAFRVQNGSTGTHVAVAGNPGGSKTGWMGNSSMSLAGTTVVQVYATMSRRKLLIAMLNWAAALAICSTAARAWSNGCTWGMPVSPKGAAGLRDP